MDVAVIGVASLSRRIPLLEEGPATPPMERSATVETLLSPPLVIEAVDFPLSPLLRVADGTSSFLAATIPLAVASSPIIAC